MEALFRVVTSSMIALKEGCPVVRGTSCDRSVLVEECRDLWRGLRVLERLEGWMTVVQTDIPREHGKNATYLIELDTGTKTTKLKAYSAEKLSDAYADYAAAEFDSFRVAELAFT